MLNMSIIPNLMVSRAIFPYTSANYYCFQERFAIRMEMIYRLTHLPAILIWGLTTGSHTIIASNSNLLTSSSIMNRCLLGTSTSFLVSGQHLLRSMRMSPLFQMLKNFMMSLIPLLLATSSGNHLAYSIMELSLHTTYHHGCKQNMTSGFKTPKLLSIICCQTLILNLISIMCPFKSTVPI